MPLLEKKYKQVVWLDSDLIVTRDCRNVFEELDDAVLTIAQEPASLPNQGTEKRTLGWGWQVGRRLPVTLNSSVLRVTQHHLPLLQRWKTCMEDPRYISCQAQPLEERALHMMSDQDVLNGLLGSTEFSATPLRILRSGMEIIHAGGALGYSTVERLRSLLNPKPTFLHATAGKPWLWLGGQPYWSQRNFFSWHRRLLQELSPYLFEARQYEELVDWDCAWMHKRTVMGTLLRLVGFGHFAMRGFPLTMAASIAQGIKKLQSNSAQRPELTSRA